MGSSPEVWPMMSLSLTTSGVPVKLQLHFFVSSTVVDHASLPVVMLICPKGLNRWLSYVRWYIGQSFGSTFRSRDRPAPWALTGVTSNDRRTKSVETAPHHHARFEAMAYLPSL